MVGDPKVSFGVSSCLDMVSIETLDLNIFKSQSQHSRNFVTFTKSLSRQFEKYQSQSRFLDLVLTSMSRTKRLNQDLSIFIKTLDHFSTSIKKILISISIPISITLGLLIVKANKK